jgi:polyhydroxybutyrate depolymerase
VAGTPGRWRPSRRVAVAGLALLASAPLALGASASTPRARIASRPERCLQPPLPGTRSIMVTSQATSQAVLVHVPRTHTHGRPMPLLLNLHGSSQSGSLQQQMSGTDATADAHGFVVAYPNGGIPASHGATLPRGYFWNVPGAPLIFNVPVPPGSRDDVHFIADTIATLVSSLCLDGQRVYVTGYSGGARMASALACLLSSRVAAIAPVAGVRAGDPGPDDPSRPDPRTCAPERAVPVIAIHGRQDPLNGYDGGHFSGWSYSVPAAVRRWADIDGCDSAPSLTPVTQTVELSRFLNCRRGAQVRLYTSSTGGHTWPGHPESASIEAGGGGPVLGPVDMSIDANEVMWSFLSRQRLQTTRARPSA